MPMYWLTLAVTGIVAVSATASAELNGMKIRVLGGEAPGKYVPVEMALETTEAPAMIAVVNKESGTRYPATLGDGKLTFIVDELAANASISATVEAGERPADKPVRIQISKKNDGDILEVRIDDVHFTSYHFGATWKKPFLWPINSAGGVGLTRSFPMEVESTPKIARDHPHHKSLWSAYGEVNGIDLWAEGVDSGTQKSGEVTFGSGDAYGWIRAANVWQDKDGKPIVNETREYRFYAVPEAERILDARVVFNAAYGQVLFSDTKEGGIVAVRMRPDICHAHAVITNALGDQGEDTAWGKPSPWCDFSGEVPDVGWRGLAIFDHPDNLRHPSSWHVRNYGLMGANAFGYSYFNEKEYNHGLIPENGDYTIEANGELAFSYRIYVHSGNVGEAAVAARYKDYAAPPKAEVKQ